MIRRADRFYLDGVWSPWFSSDNKIASLYLLHTITATRSYDYDLYLFSKILVRLECKDVWQTTVCIDKCDIIVLTNEFGGLEKSITAGNPNGNYWGYAHCIFNTSQIMAYELVTPQSDLKLYIYIYIWFVLI